MVIKFAALSAARTSRDVPSVQWNALLFESSEHESRIAVKRLTDRHLRAMVHSSLMHQDPKNMFRPFEMCFFRKCNSYYLCFESLFVRYYAMYSISRDNHKTGFSSSESLNQVNGQNSITIASPF